MITCSERVFQDQVNAMVQAFETQRDLGLGLDSASIWHNGFEVVERMPRAASLGALTCHLAVGRIDVRVFADGCIPVSEADLASAIHAIAAAAIPDGQVRDQMRFATTDEEFVEFYRELPELPAEGDRFNVWFVRRVGRRLERGGGLADEITAVVHNFELRYLRAFLDQDGFSPVSVLFAGRSGLIVVPAGILRDAGGVTFDGHSTVAVIAKGTLLASFVINGTSFTVAAAGEMTRLATFVVAGQSQVVAAAAAMTRAASFTVAGQSQVSAAVAIVRAGVLAVVGQSQLAAVGGIARHATFVVAGQSQVSVTPAGILRSASFTAAGQSQISAAAAIVRAAALTVVGQSQLAAAGTMTRGAALTIVGQSQASAAALMTRAASFTVAGQSNVAVVAAAMTRAASFTVAGQSQVSATAAAMTRAANFTVSAQSQIAAASAITRSAAVAVAGQSQVAATATVTRVASAAVSGTSNIAASATVTRNASFAIAGQSQVAASGTVTFSLSPVQQAVSGGLSVSLSSAPASGNSLVAVITVSSGTVDAVSGGGVTWSLAVRGNAGGVSTEIWYGHNSSGSGTTITATVSRGVTGHAIHAAEWASLANVSPDSTNFDSDTSNAPGTDSVTTSADHCLLIGAASWPGNEYASGPTNGFTRLTQINDATYWQEEAYRTVGATGTYSTGWTLANSVAWRAAIAAFEV